MSKEKYASYIECVVIGEPVDGHAYSERDVGEFRKSLQIDSKKIPDKKLQRLMGEFAIHVGTYVQLQAKKSPARRIKLLEKDVLKPTKRLINFFESQDFRDEFHSEAGKFYEIPPPIYYPRLIKLKRVCEEHITILEQQKERGKASDSDCRKQFVRDVVVFCKYFSPAFKPTRSVQENKDGGSIFQSAVSILSLPLFENQDFVGHIRKVVDEHNELKRKKL